MQILIHKSKSFHRGATVLTIGRSTVPQTVPDWVRDTETFRLAAQDGSVQEVVIVPPPPPPPPPQPASAPDEPEAPTKKKK